MHNNPVVAIVDTIAYEEGSKLYLWLSGSTSEVEWACDIIQRQGQQPFLRIPFTKDYRVLCLDDPDYALISGFIFDLN